MFQLVPLLLLIGGALVLIGLVGGGLEMREVRLPRISGAMRILAIVLGMGFVASGVFMGYRQIIEEKEAKRAKEKIEEDFAVSVKQLMEKAKERGQEKLENTVQRVQKSTEDLSLTDKTIANQFVSTAFESQKDVARAELETKIEHIREALQRKLESEKFEELSKQRQKLEQDFKNQLAAASEESEKKWEAKLQKIETETKELVKTVTREVPPAPPTTRSPTAPVTAPDPHGMVKEYFEFVRNRNADAAIAMWKDPSPGRRKLLRGLIEESDYVVLHQERVEERRDNWAVVSFRITSKPQGAPRQEWVGAFELELVDSRWKIARQTRADQIR